MGGAAHAVIRNGRLLDIAGHAAPATDILIAGDTVAAIGAPGLAAPPDARVVDAADRLLMPGLVNAHTHGHGNLAKGMGDVWTLELLLNAGPYINGHRSLEDKYLSGLLGGLDMIRSGTTACYDLMHEFPLPTAEGIAAAARGYGEAGLRVVLAPMVADHSFFEAIPGLIEALPSGLARDVERFRTAPAAATLAALRSIVTGWTGDADRARIALAPTIPLHCSDAFITGCRDLAAEFGVALHMHLAESRVQAVSGVRRYGKTLTAHLDALGFLGVNFTGAHGVWLDDDDIARLADRGCAVAHNPGSNMRLGSGIAPARRMKERGVVLGIGTDGASCSDNQNMFEAMRLASFASRIVGTDHRSWHRLSFLAAHRRGAADGDRGQRPRARPRRPHRQAGAGLQGRHRLSRPRPSQSHSAQRPGEPARPQREWRRRRQRDDRRPLRPRARALPGHRRRRFARQGR